MTTNGWVQFGLLGMTVALLTRPTGAWLVGVYSGSFGALGFAERAIYRVMRIDPNQDQPWTRYAEAMLTFSVVSMLMTYLVLRLQGMLPLNPQHLGAVAPSQAFETAASFTTNTNWQSYAGESTMSYFSQLTQFTFHNVASAATGMAVAAALVRGVSRKGSAGIGNFWVDLVRGTLYVLLPLSLVLALVFVQQGTIQTLQTPVVATTLEGVTQTLAMGPVASQEAIKLVGTNGGGFFNANSAHPFENPTPLTNFLQIVAILLIPAGFTRMYGRLVSSPRHGWVLWSVMGLLLTAGGAASYYAEAHGNPVHAARGVDVVGTATNPGGNMEGKEVRFGIPSSTLYATVTTAASSGAVNSMHDSFTPLGGLVTMLNIQLGEVIFGGVGAGLYSMVMMVILTVFIAGLMVGRTPEYLGKKIRAREVQVASLYALIFPAAILVPTAASAVLPQGLAGLANAGPHGLSEILYAFTSTAGNNGSAFAGLSGGSTWYNTLFGLVMLTGRFAMMVPVLALAGFLGEQGRVPDSSGTFPVTTVLFGVLLISVIAILGALTFFPALALGPVAEHYLVNAGRLF